MSVTTRLRGFNFLFFSMFALFISFLPVYADGIGISGTHIGIILSMGSLISIFFQPLWGMVSDRTRTIRRVLLLLLACSIVAGALMYHSTALWSLALFVALMNVFYLPTDPLVESLNFQTTQKENVSYGSVRMFGAMGYAVTSLLAGFGLQYWGMGSLSWIYAGVGVGALLIAFTISDVQASSKPALFGHLKQFFMQSHTLVFFLIVLVVAIPHKMNDTFIGLYMEQLGGSVKLTGVSWFVMTITETVFFAISAKLIKPGKERLFMTAAAGLYAVRFLISALADRPYELVGVQVLQGVTFVLFYVGAMQYLYSIVPEQWKSTGQTMLTVLFFGASGIVGSSIGGWIIESWGGHALYEGMAAIAAVGFVLSLVLLRQPEAESA
ncbi:MFS transporter [Cohnella yongneupensis]|uniref:MFS transporter n=1 Tax=Cohnella yongneupensis TaxID=425006 RepID=A0ABW0R2H7_9BACL